MHYTHHTPQDKKSQMVIVNIFFLQSQNIIQHRKKRLNRINRRIFVEILYYRCSVHLLLYK